MRGIQANRAVCESFIERSLALVTPLVPRLGYDRAAAIAKQAYDSGRTIREAVLSEGILSAAELERLLGPLPDP